MRECHYQYQIIERLFGYANHGKLATARIPPSAPIVVPEHNSEHNLHVAISYLTLFTAVALFTAWLFPLKKPERT